MSGEWVPNALGTSAAIQRKINLVLVKDAPNLICAIDAASRLASLQSVEKSIANAKTVIKRNATYGTLTLHVSDTLAANKVCTNGIAWKSLECPVYAKHPHNALPLSFLVPMDL
ncbi:hypothetical protein SEPCBS119000_005730 [Sporothrix epigloea]|uniref:Uncharacterized protein n=1 Tax=Sporothrix epigloea TaxID=1892477 RepID=A0ABP0DZE2_9PEZI